MKYLITESQAKIAATFHKLDMKKFIQIDRNDSVYFVKSENDEYAQIRYDKSDGLCGIHYKLIYQISSFFSLEESDSKQVIGRWVENTLHMRVTNTWTYPGFSFYTLRIPSK
jgi:hypothetical protein